MRLQAEGAKITRLNMGLAEQEATRKVSEGDAAALVDLARAESSALHTLASTMRTDGASNIDYMIALRLVFRLAASRLHIFMFLSHGHFASVTWTQSIPSRNQSPVVTSWFYRTKANRCVV